MDERAASELVARARAEPTDGYAQLERALDDASSDAVRAILLRGLGDAARWVTTIDDSITLLDRSIALAESAGRSDLVGESLLTLAGTQALGGRNDTALLTLDRAVIGASAQLRARIDFQRATIFGREGRLDEALVGYDKALPYFEATDDRFFIAATLGNRGMVLLDRGEARAAKRDLERALSQFEQLGIAKSVAAMEHNLGRVAGRSGDVIAALRHFRASEDQHARLAMNPWEVQVNRCEVLLQAGLYSEAEHVATRTATEMASRGLMMDQAEATFAESLALLGQSRYADAAVHARHAAILFAEQGRDAWAMRADVIGLLQSDETGGETRAERAILLAKELEAAGQWLAAGHAWSVVALWDPVVALAGFDAVPLAMGEAPLEYRLSYLAVLARERVAAGDRSGALRATRQAIELGQHHRLLRGSADLRAAVSAQLEATAQLGLQLRRDLGRPMEVLRWVDRCRNASSAEAGATTGKRSNEQADLFAQLRAVQTASRTASHSEAAELLRRQASLQRRLVSAGRLGAAGGRAANPALPPNLREYCKEMTVVQHHVLGGQLGAVVVDKHGPRVVDLASTEQVKQHQAQLRRAIRQLARGRSDGVGAVHRHALALGELVLPPLHSSPTLIVPVPEHTEIPWSLLPLLSDVPVTVAPSIRHWLRERKGSEHQHIELIALIEGVDLQTATGEIDGIRAAWSKHPTMEPRPATVGATLEALARADLVHVACHGRRREHDGRFAELRLADGDLTSFEIEQLESTPRIVVMAACEAGLLEPLPGDEAAGLATALFGAGTSTVIAPITLLPDTASTAAFFVDLHANLAAGRPPSEALFQMQRSRPAGVERALAQSISCFGCG